MSESKIKDLMKLCYVPRWGVVPMARAQSVAEHSFRVAALTSLMAERLGLHSIERLKAVMLALQHDGDEVTTGDIPGNFKKLLDTGTRASILGVIQDLNPWMSPLPDFKLRAVVKAADLAEAWLWASRWCAEGGSPTKFEVTKGLADELTDHMEKNFDAKEREAILSVITEVEGA